ncbi:MAG TPA: class I poly(R)-hydroxyalkanoic acid synthase [Burkholderiales bacterium]|nr:class I poly(R)-hydroxyalkanoic acid synthase [Burkholderiales bacterium]
MVQDASCRVPAGAPGAAAALGEALVLPERLLRELLRSLPESDALTLHDLFRGLATQPERVAEIQNRHYREHLALWIELLPTDGSRPRQTPEPAPSDRRFSSAEWRTLPWFEFLKRSYLINARWLTELLESVPMPSRKKQRAAFVLRQCLDALAPTNFPATNPEVIRLAAQSNGASLAQGLANLREDLARGRMRMSDENAFEVGRNVAVTPGSVVYQNPTMQLIQYAPRTDKVHAHPLFIVPPFINKYYILDLQPENSFVRYALDRGMQVFLVSWRNVPRELGSATWEDYIRHGVCAPLEAVQDITGADKINVLGFCVGGTLLASALAVMDDPQRIASLTLLAAMLDFSDVGEVGVYIDENYVRHCEEIYRDGGLVPGSLLASTFASLRANELVWSFVINNYLKGEAPPAFDLLYWNSDSANLPGPLYAWYLRNAYLENNLRTPGKLTLCARPVNLRSIGCPAFVLATREDHIVPWRSAYASTQLLGGRIEFVLGASGHVAGIVNPPSLGRRSHWVGAATPRSADDWLAQASSVAGSWWPHWVRWLRRRSGVQMSAPVALGSVRHPEHEPAPGGYVRERGH